MPERIQRKRTRGWKKQPNCVIVDRTSRWGNPFRIGDLVRDPGYNDSPPHPYDGMLPEGRHGNVTIRAVRDRADAVELFAAYIACHDDEWPVEVIRRDLGGKDLACTCPLPAEGEIDWCHANWLIQIANDAA